MQAQTIKQLSFDEMQKELATINSKVVIVNFWASWCGPCNQEIPHLNELVKKYGPNGFVVLGLNTQKDLKKEETHAKKLHANFPILLDMGEIKAKYPHSNIPTNFFIDRKGIVRECLVGFEEKDLLEKVEKYMSEVK